MIPIAQPIIDKEELLAVTQVLKSGMLAQGKKVEQFEKAFAKYTEVSHTIAVTNGTVGLDLALKTVNIQKDDEIITTPFSFIATANCILYQQAKPVFADIDPISFNIKPENIESLINKKTKAILIVHLFGQPAEMEKILQIAKKHNLLLIEDCAQAHGATFDGQKIGTFGDISVFSFYPTKNMTTSEGGMITTPSKKLADRLRILRNQGQEGKYNHTLLGYNYRMTDLTAAIGLVQLKKLPEFNKKRQSNAQFLNENLASIKNIQAPKTNKRNFHVWHQYVIRTKLRDKLKDFLEKEKIQTAIHYPKTILEQPLYKKLGFKAKSCPEATKASHKVLSLPVHPGLTKKDLKHIVSSVQKFYAQKGDKS